MYPQHQLTRNLLTGRPSRRTLSAAEALKYVFGDDLVALWPLDEPSGTAVLDTSGNGFDGVNTNATVNQPGGIDGQPFYNFNGTSARCAMHSAGLAAALDMDEFTVGVFGRDTTGGTWTDGDTNRIFAIRTDASNLMQCYTAAVNNRFTFNRTGDGTSKNISKDSLTTTGWFHMGMTVSIVADEQIAYWDGEPVAAATTGLDAYVGTPATEFIGSLNASTGFWPGDIQLVFWANRPATASEMLNLYNSASIP